METDWRRGWPLAGVLAVISVTLSACGGMSSSNASSAVGAAVTTAVAGTLWVAAGGCRLQGCPWGSFCDDEKERCVVMSCGEGCPKGSYCNESIDRCEDTPSVTRMPPPSDQPPSDQTLQRPVTTPIPFGS